MYGSPLWRVCPEWAPSATAYARSMIDRSPFGWCVRTVRSSCSTSSRRADREKIRGTSRRRDDVWAGGTVSVMRSPPLRVKLTILRPRRRVSGGDAREFAAASTRSSRLLIAGSFSRSSEYSGAATKIVEYAATIVPTKIDSERSVSV